MLSSREGFTLVTVNPLHCSFWTIVWSPLARAMSHRHQAQVGGPGYIKHQAYSCPQWELIGLHGASKEQPHHDMRLTEYDKQFYGKVNFMKTC